MKTAAIILDSWKLPIFERHLQQSGYTVAFKGQLNKDSTLLKIATTSLEALAQVVKAANTEAAQSKGAT